MVEINRRRFVAGLATMAGLLKSQPIFGQQSASRIGEALPAWKFGSLEIHHISTGRGNCVLVICPDGTSVMVDAGAVRGSTDALGPARPNASKRPGEWLARYAQQRIPESRKGALDYIILTHFHGDHIGDVTAGSPSAKSGRYRLTGVTDVAELLPVRCLIDRGYPDYNFPAPLTDESTLNYIQFAKHLAIQGSTVQQLRVGSQHQITLKGNPASFPSFSVHNLAANGVVWTGQGENTVAMFPDVKTLRSEELPPENACSIALRFTFGAFRYYIGGDLTCSTRFGTAPWLDVESAVARIAGPANVAALDHHGYFDASGPTFVREMRSRIYVLQAWHASHPALSVLEELYSEILYPGPRDVFATGLVQAASLADGRLSDKMLSQHGHVVVRVAPGGQEYEVLVLDDTNEALTVTGSFGPYAS